MELFILNLVVLLRPLAGIRYGQAFFELAGVALFLMLLAALLVHLAARKSLKLSAVDLIIVALVLWSFTSYAAYFEVSRIQDLAKLIIPLLSYVVVKNIVGDARQYRRVVLWTIAGFSVPVMLSAALIATGKGLDYVSYWTDVPRWQGAYVGAHSLGHSMTLFLMAAAIFLALGPPTEWSAAARAAGKGMLAALGGAALYCLYMSQVRTAALGLIVFALVYTFFLHRRLFLYGSVVSTIVAALTLPYWAGAFLPEYVMMQQGVELELMDLGSDRPRFWLNDLRIFAQLPLDQKLAGAGIGSVADDSGGEVLYGHNDWLQMLTQTGLVGFALFAALQVALLRAILRVPGRERYAFLALFAAVNAMMLVSNSYAWRIQVGHLYYILLAYVEIGGEPADRRVAFAALRVPASGLRYRLRER